LCLRPLVPPHLPSPVTSILCFLVSLVVSLPPVVALVSERTAAAVQAAALGGTYLLSGLPQAVSSVALAAGGQLDTHVLMSLAVVATLYLGMVQEVGAGGNGFEGVSGGGGVWGCK
jgi:Cd2+/Zn2+-exporting ATPase